MEALRDDEELGESLMPTGTVNRSAFTTREVALQWVQIILPVGGAIIAFVVLIITMVIWKTGVDDQLKVILDQQKEQGRKLDWIIQRYPTLPAQIIGHPQSRMVYPSSDSDPQDATASQTHY